MPIGSFDYNSDLTPEQRLAVEKVREGYKELDRLINQFVHPSRHLGNALVDLETSAMWAIKGITHN